MQNFIPELKRLLISKNIKFSDGVSGEKLDNLEKKCGFQFPEDLRYLHENITIECKGFYNWNTKTEEDIKSSWRWLYSGFCFDIEHAAIWDKKWGERPESLEEKIKLFTSYYENNAPKLIPIYGHRFMPSEPVSAGNPVFSIVQFDIIYYGVNLEDYLMNEFFRTIEERAKMHELNVAPRQIRFWSEWEANDWCSPIE